MFKIIKTCCPEDKVAEMRIRNGVIRDKVGVVPTKEKMRESILRWFGHIKRSMDATMRRCEMIVHPECRRVKLYLRKFGTK